MCESSGGIGARQKGARPHQGRECHVSAPLHPLAAALPPARFLSVVAAVALLGGGVRGHGERGGGQGER